MTFAKKPLDKSCKKGEKILIICRFHKKTAARSVMGVSIGGSEDVDGS